MAPGFVGVLVFAVAAGCAARERPPAAQTSGPASDPSAPAACPAPTLSSGSIADISGWPRVTIRYPAYWPSTKEAEDYRMSFNPARGPVVIVNAFYDAMSDEDILRKQMLDPTYPECSEPVKRVEPNGTRVWTGTCRNSVATLKRTYYAAPQGIVVVTIDRARPLGPCVQAELDRFFEDLEIAFTGPSPDDRPSPCAASIRHAGPHASACLDPAAHGRYRAEACRADLEKSGWTRDAPAAAAMLQRTGKTWFCLLGP